MNTLTEKIRSGLCRFVGEILLEAGLVSPQALDHAVEIQKQTHELLGQILVRQGHLTQQQLVDVLEIQLNNRYSRGHAERLHKHLGEILLEKQAISRWQLSRALQEQGVREARIGEVLVHLGYTTRGKVEQALSDQAIGAMPTADKRRVPLGELLLQTNRITPEQLHFALEEQRETHDYLGNVLLRQNVLNEDELEDLLTTQLLLHYIQGGSGRETQPAPVKKKIGEILVDTHQLTREQLEQAVAEQHRSGARRLGDILVEKGLLPLKELVRALRLQKRLATLVMGSALGMSLLTACGTPQVPLQAMPYGEVAPTMVTQSVSSGQALAGPFKVLQVGEGQRIKIYQNGSKVLENVPFFHQGSDNTCGQAVMSSLLNYWGIQMTYQQVVNEANPGNLPTTDDAVTTYLRKKGLNAQDYRGGNVDHLVAQINKGRPVPVLLDFGGMSQEHYVLVVGYNQKKGTLVLHDSLEGPYVEMEMTLFQKMWENQSIRQVHIFASSNYKRLYFDVFR